MEVLDPSRRNEVPIRGRAASRVEVYTSKGNFGLKE